MPSSINYHEPTYRVIKWNNRHREDKRGLAVKYLSEITGDQISLSQRISALGDQIGDSQADQSSSPGVNSQSSDPTSGDTRAHAARR
jgi:hypothetical protein